MQMFRQGLGYLNKGTTNIRGVNWDECSLDHVGDGRFSSASIVQTRSRSCLTPRILVVPVWRDMELSGGHLTPSLEIGLRQDGGDAETGFGVEIGVGGAWSDPVRGLSVELKARGLLTHEDADFRDFGLSAELAWDPSPSTERGPSFMLRQTAGGTASGGMDALLTRDTLAGLSDAAGSRQFEARLGYGLPALRGKLTAVPEIGLGTVRARLHARLADCAGAERPAGLRVHDGLGAARKFRRQRAGAQLRVSSWRPLVTATCIEMPNADRPART